MKDNFLGVLILCLLVLMITVFNKTYYIEVNLKESLRVYYRFGIILFKKSVSVINISEIKSIYIDSKYKGGEKGGASNSILFKILIGRIFYNTNILLVVEKYNSKEVLRFKINVPKSDIERVINIIESAKVFPVSSKATTNV